MMTTKPGILRRTYDLAAFFAVLNMTALAGLGGYLAATGAVDGEKVQKIAAVLRGQEMPAAQDDAAGSAPAGAGKQSEPSRERPTESAEDVEIVHREAERIKAEIEQRLALSNAILLKVRTEREAFQKERESAARREQDIARRRRDEGFQKQVAILEALSPKMAVQHLLGIEDPDDAARLLTAMDTSKAKKIVEAAKRGADLTQMKLILQRVRETAPDQSAELNAGEDGERS